jgi:uncharacterized protein YjcR
MSKRIDLPINDIVYYLQVEGRSYSQLATKYGCSPQTIMRRHMEWVNSAAEHTVLETDKAYATERARSFWERVADFFRRLFS